jgi:hypothetical protein
MQRRTLCLRLVAGLAVLAAVLFGSLPSQGAEKNPSAWRFRVNAAPAVSQILTVTRVGGYDWFDATDATGKGVRVVFPRRFASVQRGGKWVPIPSLRTGDQVEVWGSHRGGNLLTARARVVTEQNTADSGVRRVSSGCCGA